MPQAMHGKVDETHFSVTAKVEISDQFFGWILGFGKKAKILYPEDVNLFEIALKCCS